MKNSISISYDLLLDLYDKYPNLENELRIVERKISKSYKVIKRISESDKDYSNFFARKKVLRTLRKIKTSTNDAIDHLLCISHPRAFFNNKFDDGYLGNWGSHKKYYMKKKFFKRPDHIENYDFSEIINSLETVIFEIKELKISLKDLNSKASTSDFENSEYSINEELYVQIIDLMPPVSTNNDLSEDQIDLSDWPFLIEDLDTEIDDDIEQINNNLSDNHHDKVPGWITNYKNSDKRLNPKFFLNMNMILKNGKLGVGKILFHLTYKPFTFVAIFYE